MIWTLRTPPAPVRLSRRRLHRAAAGALATGAAVAGGALSGGTGLAQSPLPDAVRAIMGKARYAAATWNLHVEDVASGEALYSLRADDLAFTGSVRKLFSVGLALEQLGPDSRVTTAVYRRGAVSGGALAGDLVLVGAGDLTLGGRRNADGTVVVSEFDHNDANNLGTAILSPQDPLGGLDALARQVAATGIRTVNGEVVVDDRLFTPYRVPNQNLLVTPVMVNENMVDVTVTPTWPGHPATVDYRPRSAAFAVAGAVGTGALDAESSVGLSGDGLIACLGSPGCTGTLEGDLPIGYRAPLSGAPTLVQTFRVEDPAAFARTALIEALARAGVAVGAPPVAPNPRDRLPASGAYAAEMRVGAFESPPYSEHARLILKVSLNLGANLSLSLFGLANGQTGIDGALAAERRALTERLGLAGESFAFPTNGSGSPDSQATPRAVVRLLTAMGQSRVAEVFHAGLPVLGVDGSLAGTGADSPARGFVSAKTGTTISDGMLRAQNLAGYIEARSGRRLAFALFVNNAGPLQRIEDVTEVLEDEAAITSAVRDAL
jgi:D-alanyl-D-alanine carboxypeptidase/D-alanyl-D-alanine-endopeptidase (penicillin-binding protein 4)